MCHAYIAPNTPPIPALPSTLLRPLVRQSTLHLLADLSILFVSAPTDSALLNGQLMIDKLTICSFRLIHA